MTIQNLLNSISLKIIIIFSSHNLSFQTKRIYCPLLLDHLKGYTAVDFAGKSTFAYSGCINAECSATATAYLNQSSNYWNWDTNSYNNAVNVYNNLNFANIDLPNDVAIGGGKGFRNSFRNIGNLPWTTNFTGAPLDAPTYDYNSGSFGSIPTGLSLEKFGFKPPFQRETYDNSVQAVTGFGVEGLAVAAEIVVTKKASSRFSFASPSVAKYASQSKCFVTGTLIHTENGLVPIEDISLF